MKEVKGKIILIDDEEYEKKLLNESLKDRNWAIEIDHFNRSSEALEYLRDNADDIFLIISDMDMPEMNGMELKKKIDEDEALRKKSIPFVFASGDIKEEQVKEAYEYRVQGYFKKPSSLEDLSEMIERVVEYWQTCIHPNKKFTHY
ncbi:MAG: response regulator [Brumimicrobium sp.]|nr:response regulator [Brumimicrobium sp.]